MRYHGQPARFDWVNGVWRYVARLVWNGIRDRVCVRSRCRVRNRIRVWNRVRVRSRVRIWNRICVRNRVRVRNRVGVRIGSNGLITLSQIATFQTIIPVLITRTTHQPPLFITFSWCKCIERILPGTICNVTVFQLKTTFSRCPPNLHKGNTFDRACDSAAINVRHVTITGQINMYRNGIRRINIS
ncbi:hypothetical protein D3C81_1227320 [compost metagenome]